jgi:hypothetical protein
MAAGPEAVAGTRPSNANSGRRAYFRGFIRSRLAVYALVLGSVAGFVYGAYRRDPLIMAIAPAAVAALVLAAAAFLADRYSANAFFRSFAEAARLDYVGRWELAPFTPLLGAGERQWCEHWMLGQVVNEPGLFGGLGQFVYERRQETGDPHARPRRHVLQRRRLTVCAIDIEQSLPLFKGVFLRQRRTLFDIGSDWLADTASRAVELESAAFTHRYELRIADDQDELLLRQLFSPSLVSWLAEHPLGPGFELRAGTLVVFVPRVLEDAGMLTFFLDAAHRITSRLIDELGDTGAGIVPPAGATKTPGL